MAAHVYRQAKYNSCTRWTCAFAVLIFLLLISAITFAACGFIIARPGISALKFNKATCTAINYTFVETKSCECGGFSSDTPGCTSLFPCIQVFVSYQYLHNIFNSSGSNETETPIAVLHEHESTMYSPHSECSIYACSSQQRANTHKVNSFNQFYGKPGRNFSCFIDAFDLKIAVISRNFKDIHVVLSLAVPGSIFLISFLATTILCVIKCKRRKPPANREHTPRSYMNASMLTDNNQPVQARDRPLPGCYNDLVNATQTQLPPVLTSNTTM